MAHVGAGLASTERELSRGIGSSIHFRYVCSFKQIVYGDVEVICYLYQFINAGLPVACFVSADGILVSIQVNGKSYLGDTP